MAFRAPGVRAAVKLWSVLYADRPASLLIPPITLSRMTVPFPGGSPSLAPRLIIPQRTLELHRPLSNVLCRMIEPSSDSHVIAHVYPVPEITLSSTTLPDPPSA